MTARPTEKVSKIVSDGIVCESCGEEFSCGVKTGNCWCFNVEIDSRELAKLRDNFEKCLCPDCLKKFTNISE